MLTNAFEKVHAARPARRIRTGDRNILRTLPENLFTPSANSAMFAKVVQAALLVLFLFFPAFTVKAELWSSWRSTAVSQLEIIENSTVSSIFRDHNGDILIATAENLYAFSGDEVRDLPVHWATNDGYPLDRVIGFASAPDKSLWLFTVRDGIYLKPPESEGFRKLSDRNGWEVGVEVNAAINIAKPLGVLSLSTGRAFFLDLHTGKSIRLGSARSSEKVIGIGSTPDGQIILIDNDGWLTHFSWHANGGWLSQTSVACTFEDPPVGKVSTLDGVTFVATNLKRRVITFRIDDSGCRQTVDNIPLVSSLANTRIRDILRLPKTGVLALSTDQGLHIYNDGVLESLTTTNSILRSNQVTAVAEVSTDQLLVGSYLGLIGAFRGDITTVTSFGDEGAPEVTSVSSSGDAIFIATYQGLYRLDKTHLNFAASRVRLPDFQGGISVVRVVGDKILVGTTTGQIIVINASTALVQCVVATDAIQPITGFAPSSVSSVIYAAALSGEIFLFEKCETAPGDEARIIAALDRAVIGLDAFRDHILITSFSGIHSISSDQFDELVKAKVANPLEFASLQSEAWVFTETDSGILLGNPKGELSFKNSLLSSSAAHMRPVPDTPYSIETDRRGRVWLASKSGLWIGDDDSGFSLAFRTEEMDAIGFEYKASHQTLDGTLIFGGIGGVVIIDDPTGLPKNRHGTLSIRSAKIGSNSYYPPYPLNELVVVSSSDIGIMSLSFSAPFEIGRDFHGVETMLSPLETDWTRYSSFGPVEIGPLPPGSYTFRARGANALGVWSENEIVIPITVPPPFWRSWWALMLYAFVAVLMFLFFKRVYIRHLVRKARLAYGDEAARAFSRLEDDWQEQREATDRLLRSIPVTVSTLINTMRTVVASQGEIAAESGASNESVAPVLAAIDRRLQALNHQQALCVLTTAAQTCETSQLINEVIALVTGKARHGSRYIVLDESPRLALEAGFGQTVAIILLELLELMMSREPASDQMDPIVTTCLERDDDGLRITVADRDALRPSDTLVDQTLAATFALLEDFGGSIVEKDDFGYELEIRLREPTKQA